MPVHIYVYQGTYSRITHTYVRSTHQYVRVRVPGVKHKKHKHLLYVTILTAAVDRALFGDNPPTSQRVFADEEIICWGGEPSWFSLLSLLFVTFFFLFSPPRFFVVTFFQLFFLFLYPKTRFSFFFSQFVAFFSFFKKYSKFASCRLWGFSRCRLRHFKLEICWISACVLIFMRGFQLAHPKPILTTTNPDPSQQYVTCIYRASLSKRAKAGVGEGSASSGGGSGSGSWTLVGPEPAFGNPDWPCPRKSCQGYILYSCA